MGEMPLRGAFAPDDAADLESSGVRIFSGGKGFGLTSQERKAVEAHAMKLAIERDWVMSPDDAYPSKYSQFCTTGPASPCA
jgi:hypothetical protein